MEVMSLSKAPSFSESELKALDLWDAAEQFASNKKSAIHSNTKKQKATLTVEDIEKTQKQAFDEAFEKGKKEGFEKGFEEGKKAGFEAGKLEGLENGYQENKHLLEQQSAEFVSLMESLSEPFKTLDETIEKELVDLVIVIASQIIRREIKKDPGQIIAVIREAVNALPVASQQLTLQMHPEDAELVRSSLALDEISPPWKIDEDPLVTRGGCHVRTQTSIIDATVENRLTAIVATALGGEREEDEMQ